MSKLIFIFFILILLPIGSSLVSIHSGGTDSLIVSSDKIIEGFPFTTLQASGPTGGGDITFSPINALLVCNFSKDFIDEHLKEDNLEFTNEELMNLSIEISPILGHTISIDDLKEVLLEECPIQIKFPIIPLIFLIFIFSTMVVLFINGRNKFLIIWFNKIREKRNKIDDVGYYGLYKSKS